MQGRDKKATSEATPKKTAADSTLLALTKEVQQSQERYQAFIQNSTEGIWRIEVDEPISTKLSPVKQIKLMYKHAWLAEANDAMAHMYGLESPEGLVGTRLGDLIVEEDPNNVAYLAAFIKSGYKLYGAESHETDAEGNDKYFSNSLSGVIEDGNLVRAWGTQTDVTKQRKAEIRLQESEERFRSLADTAPVFIWLADTNNLGTYFNKPWLEFTGRKLEQELGTGWTEAVHPDDLEQAASYCQNCFDARKEFRMEFRLRRHDGKYRWVLDHGIPHYAPDGTFRGYIGSCLDIEDFKRALKRQHRLEATNTSLKKQREQLIALNSAKDEFISLASHQLRTPASGVKQYIGMLVEGYAGELSEKQHILAKKAFVNNERQLKIINDLLRVARIDANNVKPDKSVVDISALIASVAEDMRSKVNEKRQKIVHKLSDKPVLAEVDERLVRMVIENLIDNASKYSPPNTNITLSINDAGKSFQLKCLDQGVGIASEDFDKLFQKFSRLESPLSVGAGGSGLGLYWAKKLIDLHNGTIKVSSTPGKGSVFTVSLPR